MTSPAVIFDPSTVPSTTARRSPRGWILAWAAYSLLALGYFGYRQAWLGTFCGAS